MVATVLLRKLFIPCLIVFAVLTTACNLPAIQSAGLPTTDIARINQTVQADMTPLSTQTPAPSDSGVTRLTSTITPGVITPATPLPKKTTSVPTRTCDQASAGSPIDVTIPDDTEMDPGQTFIKIWRLNNSGACTWTNKYSITYFSGEQMGAPYSLPLDKIVLPGQSIDIALDMVAPEEAGTFQGNWKLSNESNVLFGIGPSGSASFWVRIIVKSTPAPSSTPVTPTPTNTASPTPGIYALGTLNLNINDTLDLDSLQINLGTGEDLKFTTNESGKHVLAPLGSAIIGVFGQTQPKHLDCQGTRMDPVPVNLDNLIPGSHLCYLSDQARLGWAQLEKFDAAGETIALKINTWSIP